MSAAGVARAAAVAAVLALLGCTAPVSSPTTASPTSPSSSPSTPGATPTPSTTTSPRTPSPVVRFSALGDIGSTDAADAVLTSIAARHDDFTLALGDLSYGEPGEEERWCGFVTRRVGPRYPFQLVSGNHESNGEDGDIDRFVRCLPDRLGGVVGTYGRQWYVDRPARQPLVRVVMVSPALDFGDGPWSYGEDTARYRWLRDAVTDARAHAIPWVVVGMHKPCLSVGRYACDPGSDLVDLLLRTGVDLVLTGHEHLYQRSRPLALGAGCATVPTGRFDADCVAQGRGTTFVTVGTGGTRLRGADEGDPEWPWFSAVSAAGRRPSHGSLEVRVTADRLTATFVPVGEGTFTDRLVLRR